MTNLLHLGQTGTDDDLPFCMGGDGCTACNIQELGRDLALFGDVEGHEGSTALGRVYFRPGSRRGEEVERELLRREAEYDPDMAYERYLEDRFDPEAMEDLAWHNELWPTYYGCPSDPGANL